MRAITRIVAENLLGEFDSWVAGEVSVVRTGADDVRKTILLVRRLELGLQAPDALHLVLARRADTTVVTLDKVMARAAEELGLSVAPLPI